MYNPHLHSNRCMLCKRHMGLGDIVFSVIMCESTVSSWQIWINRVALDP